jgi:V/A-type H+-transporting ATPase subunit F
MAQYDMAIIGTSPNIALFKSIGIDVHFVDTLEEIDKLVFTLSQAGTKLIYVEDHWFLKMAGIISKYQYLPFPIIVPIPLEDDKLQVGIKKIRDNVRKAIGIDIF